MFVSGSLVEGGDGAPGDDTFGPCVDGGSGGNGISMVGTRPVVRVLDSLVLGGSGDAPSGSPCVAGADGSDFGISAGSVLPPGGPPTGNGDEAVSERAYPATATVHLQAVVLDASGPEGFLSSPTELTVHVLVP